MCVSRSNQAIGSPVLTNKYACHALALRTPCSRHTPCDSPPAPRLKPKAHRSQSQNTPLPTELRSHPSLHNGEGSHEGFRQALLLERPRQISFGFHTQHVNLEQRTVQEGQQPVRYLSPPPDTNQMCVRHFQGNRRRVSWEGEVREEQSEQNTRNCKRQKGSLKNKKMIVEEQLLCATNDQTITDNLHRDNVSISTLASVGVVAASQFPVTPLYTSG